MSAWTEEEMQRILTLCSEGMSVAEVARMPGMPRQRTLYAWLARDLSGLGDRYRRERYNRRVLRTCRGITADIESLERLAARRKR